MPTATAGPRPALHPPAPRLALRVGVTGHRLERLLKPDVALAKVEAALRAILTTVAERAEAARIANPDLYCNEPALLRLVSPLAEGTDQISASIAIDCGYQLDVPLPFAPEHYLAHFQTVASPGAYPPRETFTRLIGDDAVAAVQRLDGDASTSEGLVAGYQAVGRTVLAHADLLIAVWDGSYGGPGGTGDIVDQARDAAIPVVHVDPRSPDAWAVRPLRGETPPLDALVDTLLAGPPPVEHEDDDEEPSVASPLREYLTTRPGPAVGGVFTMLLKLVGLEGLSLPRVLPAARTYVARTRAAWMRAVPDDDAAEAAIRAHVERRLLEPYAWADQLADRFGALHRDVFSSMYVLAPIAVFAALLSLFGPSIDPSVRDIVWTRMAMLELTILVGILAMYGLARRGHYHQRWIDCRSLAEQLRQLTFLWPIGRPTQTVQFRGESAGEAPRFTWISWYCRAVVRELGLCPVEMTPAYLAACQRLLADEVIASQRAYHHRTAHRMHRVHHVLHVTATLLFFAAAVMSAWHLWHLWHEGLLPLPAFLSHATPAINHSAEAASVGRTHWLAVVAVLLPTVAAAIHGFLSQGDLWNLRRRSQRMARELDALAERLAAIPCTSQSLGDAAEETADVFGDEVVHWRVFVRLKPIALV